MCVRSNLYANGSAPASLSCATLAILSAFTSSAELVPAPSASPFFCWLFPPPFFCGLAGFGFSGAGGGVTPAATSIAASSALSSFSAATPATTASSLFVAPAALSAFTLAPAAATASAAALSSSAVGASVLRAWSRSVGGLGW